MEEDMKILEQWLKELNILFQKTYINNTKERKALENLLNSYKELEEENKKYWKLYCKKRDERVLNSIPTSVIKDKIEEIKLNKNHKYTAGTVVAIMNELEELLEDK